MSMMKSVLYLSVLACLALWCNYASAFVTPNFGSYQGVSRRSTNVVSVSMTENANDSENDVAVEAETKIDVEEIEAKSSDKDTSVETEEKKDIPWMELLGAAAELAGALGNAAAQAASAALDDMTPKEEIDVSIPYDSACSQAYTEWLAQYEKEDPELERYENFKRNYQTVTIANVVAKKKIRDGIPEGEEKPEFLKLNKYADLSEEEYREVQKSLEPKSWGDLFGELASVAGKAAMDLTTSNSSPKANDKPAVAAKGKKNVVSAKKPTAKKTLQSAKKKAPAADNSFTFFGFGTKSVKKPTNKTKKQAPKRVYKKAPPKKKAAPVVGGIPVLSRWRQNKDGSLTGYVSNSSSFRTGTRITTSPVPKGAKGGSVVRTGSGSRYRLK